MVITFAETNEKWSHIGISFSGIIPSQPHPATNVIDVFDKCDIVRFVIDVIS
jgi:hypothetical protein